MSENEGYLYRNLGQQEHFKEHFKTPVDIYGLFERALVLLLVL